MNEKIGLSTKHPPSKHQSTYPYKSKLAIATKIEDNINLAQNQHKKDTIEDQPHVRSTETVDGAEHNTRMLKVQE